MEIEILQHRIEYWYKDEQKMPEHEQDHVRQMITEGFNSGELIDTNMITEETNRGWWSIK